MGWKTRGGRSYFYQSEREGGRVVSRYFGSGEAAGLIAQLQQIECEKRQLQAFDHRAERERGERFGKRIARACRSLTIAADALIEASGYHRHHRGEWRRRRTMSTALPAAIEGVPADSTTSLAERYRSGEDAAWDEVSALLAKADKGDKEAARAIGRLLKAAPEVAELTACNIAEAIESKLIRKAFGEKSLGTAEAARLKLESLRAELAGPNASAVERLLAERAALCWLDHHYAEYCELSDGNRSIRQADFWARQRDRAYRRYLAALKALASVRKLPIVAVQVNVGQPASSHPEGGHAPQETT